MARITVEDCLEKVSNRFALIHLAAKRVRELRKGAEPLISAKNSDNVIALREIAAGKVFIVKTLKKTEPTEEATKTKMPALEEIYSLEKGFMAQKPAQAEVMEGPGREHMRAPYEQIDDSEIEAHDEEAFDKEAFDEEAFDEERDVDIGDPFDYMD